MSSADNDNQDYELANVNGVLSAVWFLPIPLNHTSLCQVVTHRGVSPISVIAHGPSLACIQKPRK